MIRIWTKCKWIYSLISQVTNYTYNCVFFTCLLYWELPAQIFDFFNKIPVRVLLDVLFCMFRFSRASFNAPTSSFITLWHNLGTKTHRTLPWRLCNFYVWNYKFMLIFNAKVVTHDIMIRIKTGKLSQSRRVMKFYKVNCDLVKPNLCFPFCPITLKIVTRSSFQ